MSAGESVQSVKSTLSSVVDLLKKKWFVSLLLWCVFAVQVFGVFTGVRPLSVARNFLEGTLGLAVLTPFFDWVEPHLIEPLYAQPGWGIATVVVCILVVISLIYFFRDARSGIDFDDPASSKIMLRFVAYSTFATLYMDVSIFVWLLVLTALATGIASASTTIRAWHWRESLSDALGRLVSGFAQGVFVFLLSVIAVAIYPILLIVLGFWIIVS